MSVPRPCSPAGEATAPARLALRREEAARALGISDEAFDKYVRPHLRAVKMGRVTIYPVRELERYLE